MRLNRLAILVATLAAATAMPAMADQYFYRLKPLVSPPMPFSLGGVDGIEPGATAVSTIASVRGYRTATVTVSGGAGAAYQICSTSSCSDQGENWRTSPTADVPDAFWARVRVTAGPFGGTTRARLGVGSAGETFTATSRAKDTSPDGFTFASVSDVNPNAATRSASVSITGHDGVTLSVTGGGYQVCSTVGCSEMDGQPVQTGTSAEVPSGTRVRLVATPTAYGQTATARLSAGDTTGTFSVTARSKDETPNAFSFAGLTGREPNADAVSSPALLTGHDGVAVSLASAGSGAGYQICVSADCSDRNTTDWATAATADVPSGRYVRAKLRPTAFSESASVTVVAGGTQAAFTVSTRAKDTTPDSFAFASKSASATASELLSDITRIAGHDGVSATLASQSGGGNPAFRVCADASCSSVVRDWSAAAFDLTAGQYVQLRVTPSAISGGTAVARLTAGSVSADWQAQTFTTGFTSSINSMLNNFVSNSSYIYAGVSGPYQYTYDGTDNGISDGGNDMFDNGHFISMGGTEMGYGFNNGTDMARTNKSWPDAHIKKLPAGNAFTVRERGDNGADNAGGISTTRGDGNYLGVYWSYAATHVYGAQSDPSINEVVFVFAKTGVPSVGVSYSGGTNAPAGSWNVASRSEDQVVMEVLLSKPNTVRVQESEIAEVARRIIERVFQN